MNKLFSRGKYFRRAASRKNGEPCLNIVKKDVIDSSEHTITFENGQILRKLDLAYKGKLLPEKLL